MDDVDDDEGRWRQRNDGGGSGMIDDEKGIF